MKGFPFFFSKTLLDRLSPYRKWGLILIPLASVTSIPLLWSWGNDAWQSGQSPTTAHRVADLSEIAKTVNAEIPQSLPPLSQIPAPPTASSGASIASSLKNPRPMTISEALKGKNFDPKAPTKSVKNPDPLPASVLGASSLNQSPTAKPTSALKPVAKAPLSQSQARPQALPKTQPLQQSAAVPVAYTPPPLEIRVGIQRDVSSVAIAASSQAYLQDRNGKGLMTINASQPLTISSQGSALVANGRILPGVVWLTPTQNSYLGVGDRWYRGRVLLVARGETLLAVNYVDLESYLTSVVGSEMHSNAPTEALKAQAIAARSYALVHMVRPASDWFDLGDTQRWQVYKGINSEGDTSRNAVTATLGQVLSYQGGVVESLYASTDEIVSSVHKGRGMSQYGAYDLAKSGYNYQQILDRYYPGVIVARVILKN